MLEGDRYNYDADEYYDDAWRLPERVSDEVRPAIAAYEAAMRPATMQEIGVILGRLAIHFPLPDRSPQHHQMAFADYGEDLAEYPVGVITEVARDWRRTEKWWPKICELRERCEKLRRRRRKELARLRFMHWCRERFNGEVPRLMRQYGDCLIETLEGPDADMLEAVIRGERVFGDLLWVLPHAGAPMSDPSPT